LVVLDETYLCCGIRGQIIAGVTEKVSDHLKTPHVRPGNPGVLAPFAPMLQEAVIPTLDEIDQAIKGTLC